MSEQYIFITDAHIYGADPLDLTIQEILNLRGLFGGLVKLCGDIIDKKNCKDKELVNARHDYMLLRQMFGSDYEDGNHESESPYDRLIFLNPFSGFMHGDRLIYGIVKSVDARTKGEGAGSFSRILKFLFSKSREVIDFKAEKTLKDDIFLGELAKIKKENPSLKRILIGHTHILKMMIVNYPDIGIDVWFLPRGITKINRELLEQ